MCQIIPGIAWHSSSELCPFEPRAPNTTPFDAETQPNTPAGNSGDPGASGSSANPGKHKNMLPPAASTTTVPQPPSGSTRVPIGIPPEGCVMVPKSAFSTAPTMDLSKGEGGSRTGSFSAPQQTSTPVKQSRPSHQSSFGKKMDISKIKAAHLLHELSDRREGQQRGGPSPSLSQTTAAACGSGVNLPPGLPAQAPGLAPSGMMSSVFGKAFEVPCPSQLAPKAKKVIPVEQMTPVKCPAPEEDDTAPEIEEIDEVSAPPKKKKKKKDKSRERKECHLGKSRGQYETRYLRRHSCRC